jgi:tetratricopeptide (TPR) repeat protein
MGIFWMSVGNMLVLDLFQSPDNRLTDLLSDENNSKNKESVKKDTSNKNAENDFKSIIRMKIKKEEDSPPSTSEKENTEKKAAVIGTDLATDIKPVLKSTLPDSSDIEVDVEKLSPEEAFLYGRIKQAKEINDYDMGIMLANQFLNDFKESGLCEVISFWRADFYYDQWEKGAKELGEEVLRSYKYAINRFENSSNVQLSYIKMAKVASGQDDGYKALGYLGNVIIKKDPDFMPLAYLTRGKIFLQLNQPEKAIKDFKILLQDYENTRYGVEANLWLGNYYHQIGLYEEAEKRLNEIDKRYPGLYLEYPEFISLNAMNNLYLKKYNEARDYLFKAVNIGGQQEPIDMLLSRIGDTYHNQENDKEAEKYYRMVIDYYPESEGASISKLRLAEYFSDITMLDDLSSDDKTNEAIGELAMLEKAYQLYENKQYAEAIDTLKDIVDKPVQTETRKDAKRLYAHSIEKEMERLKDANLYKDLVYLYEENTISIANRISPETLLTVAEAYKKLGRQSESVSAYRQIKPYDLNQDRRGDYISGLAENYISLGDRNKAISFLEKGKNEKLNQLDQQKVNLLLADIYKLDGRNEDAEKLYSQVIENIKGLPPEELQRHT